MGKVCKKIKLQKTRTCTRRKNYKVNINAAKAKMDAKVTNF